VTCVGLEAVLIGHGGKPCRSPLSLDIIELCIVKSSPSTPFTSVIQAKTACQTGAAVNLNQLHNVEPKRLYPGAQQRLKPHRPFGIFTRCSSLLVTTARFCHGPGWNTCKENTWRSQGPGQDISEPIWQEGSRFEERTSCWRLV